VLAAAAIVVLLVVLLAMNSVAIWLRNASTSADGDALSSPAIAPLSGIRSVNSVMTWREDGPK
jgi:hypothetical protein